MQPDEISTYRNQLLALALELAPDRERAEDLVQDTFLSALRSGVEEVRRGPRRWLREILRLKAREAERRDERRRRRERAAALPERLEIDRDRQILIGLVARQLEELEEPYRTTLRLRFLEELPPRAIAELLGVPLQTVYTRVVRGTSLLRERLTRRLGGIVPPVLLLWGGRRSCRLDRLRALAPQRALLVAGAVALSLVVWLFVARPRGTPAQPVLAGAPVIADARVTTSVTKPSERTALVPERVESSTVAQPSVESPWIAGQRTGRVVDELGRPVPFATVVFERGELLFELTTVWENYFKAREVVLEVSADAAGEFELEFPPGDGRVLARAPGCAPLLVEIVPADRGGDPLVPVLAPAAAISGVLLDAERRPIAGAGVSLRPPAQWIAGLDRRERTWYPARPAAVTDSEGRFALAEGYDLAGSRLELHRYDFAQTLVLAAGSHDLELVLPGVRADLEFVRGYVVTPELEPVAGAAILARRARTFSAQDGSFDLPLSVFWRGEGICAVPRGGLPVAWVPPQLESGAPDLPPEILVEVAGLALALEGRVIDSAGEPVPGAWVWPSDPTPVFPDIGNGFAEQWMATDDEWDVPFAVAADERGSFRLPFLDAREYRVGALEKHTLRSSISEPIAAGTTGVVLVIPQAPLVPLEGRVVDAQGEPFPGVDLTPYRWLSSYDAQGSRAYQVGRPGVRSQSDASGRFRIAGVPDDGGCSLRLTGTRVFETDLALAPEHGVPLEIVAPRRARLRIELRSATLAPVAVALLSAEGVELVLRSAGDDDRTSATHPVRRFPFPSDGADLIVPDTGRTLVLYTAEKELARRSIELAAGELTTAAF